ncbi:protein translocase subunit SecY [Anaerocolumna cellulosilytica]|uniref:Protein translocase subunit SecY n=1 Tax=Anaerocolumna cellulosilytica TaxID=433286 RepID=A0A6S6QQD4_9FIRM|nr:preprotein translocase subunit SecY [Anaerocolumna cellulosilytica]MBB5197352.1 preprotein translocase subunit SecY [Anaerocolumna cellulosilytica]BCJ92794.1 protein translocase subunit SecY [Anaerocolumna cellulosilytica]
MLKTFRNAFKIKDIRSKLVYTFFALIIVRLGSQLPVPRIDREYFSQWIGTQTSLGFFDTLTGGSFTQMSIFALSITPYITSSIIMQLLTIAIPKLEELQKDGEDGRKKIAEYTRYVTVGLALIESIAMAIGFGQSGLLEGGMTFNNVAIIVASLTAGSAFLMWLGERITEKGVGNGISIILLINIVAQMPNDFTNLYRQFVSGASNVVNGILASIVIILVVVAVVVFIIILQDAQRKIPVQYAKKVQGRKMVGGQSSHIPLKVNTAGVIPVIFAGSLMQFPIVVSSFLGVSPARAYFWPKVLYLLNQNTWLNFRDLGEFKYSLGLLIYIALVIFFAYFYTSITFNPIEVSNNMKKQGGFIPGIRPGKPTTEYLTKVLNNIILIGAVGLTIVAVIPIFFSGAFRAQVNFGGTSIIIVVGVVLETIKQIESQMLVRHYKGFLND